MKTSLWILCLAAGVRRQDFECYVGTPMLDGLERR